MAQIVTDPYTGETLSFDDAGGLLGETSPELARHIGRTRRYEQIRNLARIIEERASLAVDEPGRKYLRRVEEQDGTIPELTRRMLGQTLGDGSDVTPSDPTPEDEAALDRLRAEYRDALPRSVIRSAS